MSTARSSRLTVDAKDISMTTGSIVALTGPEQVQLKSFEVPEPEPGAVVLRVRRANVCGSDIHQFHYESPSLREAGLGHEFVGEIAALGEGVTTDYAGEPVAVGDRVVPVYFLQCHHCAACLRSEFSSCANSLAAWSRNPELAPHFSAGYATHYYVQPGQHFYRVPDEVDDASVAGANCGLAQMIFVLDKAGLGAGETLVVQGAGGLGLYAAAVGRERGAHVVVIDGVKDRLDLAREFGADDVIDLTDHATPADRAQAVRDLTGNVGADLVLEVTGHPAAFSEAIEIARVGGRIASVGNLNGEAEISLVPGLVTRKSLTIRGVLRYDPWYLHRAVQFLSRRAGLHPFGELAGVTYSLDHALDALRDGESRSVARAAIVP
jgi:threonine dehydrogenase-like Zn-dependent dehydrogenase